MKAENRCYCCNCKMPFSDDYVCRPCEMAWKTGNQTISAQKAERNSGFTVTLP
jgi:hypothetical protein